MLLVPVVRWCLLSWGCYMVVVSCKWEAVAMVVAKGFWYTVHMVDSAALRDVPAAEQAVG